jgi:hypothetical protein
MLTVQSLSEWIAITGTTRRSAAVFSSAFILATVCAVDLKVPVWEQIPVRLTEAASSS